MKAEEFRLGGKHGQGAGRLAAWGAITRALDADVSSRELQKDAWLDCGRKGNRHAPSARVGALPVRPRT